ncbi:MAG: hypothetical protein IJ084_06860 [Prevotella sp.]|nr:hypothetical protein [Prevotella sp.]
MNKKLFSWKALAGLALLVAMGLTSCKQGTEVDPNDPYATKTTTPTVKPTGDADLTFTLTKTADFATLWSQVAADTKTAIAKKSNVIIQINAANYELDAAELALPDFFNGAAANKVLNLVFSGNFKKAEKELNINTDALSGAQVNITLPAQTFGLNLAASKVKANLTSTGATLALQAAANTGKNALVLGSGADVATLKLTAGDIVTDGGSIATVYVDADATLTPKKGYAYGETIVNYAKNLLVDGTVTITGNDKDTPLGAISLAKNTALTFATSKPFAESVTGLDTGCSVTLQSTTYDQLANIGALDNVKITNGLGFDITKDIFTNVEIVEPAWIMTSSISDVTFDADVYAYVDKDNETVSFSGVNFKDDVQFNGGKEIKTTPSKTQYQWDIDKKEWAAVTSDAPLTEANKAAGADAGEIIASWKFYVSGTTLVDTDNLVGNHTVFTLVIENSLWVLPKNCSLALGNSKYQGAAITDSNINNFVGSGSTDPTWFTVTSGSDTYAWEKAPGGYVLVKQ